MNSRDFEALLEAQLDLCRSVLVRKADEYATEDRLHNFKVAAELQDCTPIGALAGMMAKHTVSIYDMCAGADRGIKYPLPLWREKITDHINYLLLLLAAVKEVTENKELRKTINRSVRHRIFE